MPCAVPPTVARANIAAEVISYGSCAAVAVATMVVTTISYVILGITHKESCKQAKDLQTMNILHKNDIEAESLVINRSSHFCFKTILLFLISMIVMMTGVVIGFILYRVYIPQHSNVHIRAICDIPYSVESNTTFPRFYIRPYDFDVQNLLEVLRENTVSSPLEANYFREEIELEATDDGGYAKVYVPDFKDGRDGRFIHDFKENQSAIIDFKENRCFVMPLDREKTLLPKNLMDFMSKTTKDYYNIDTKHIRSNMRVVLPPITNLSEISTRVANECFDMKVYMLEKAPHVVESKNNLPISGKFAGYFGKTINFYDLSNMNAIEKFENNFI